MKVITLFLVLVTLSMPAMAERYAAIGGGYGGQGNAGSFSIEFGSASPSRLIAVGAGFIFNQDNVPNDVLDYPVPHWNFVDLGTRQHGVESALFMKYGLPVGQAKRTFVYGIGGLSFSREIELARSLATGWYYTEAEESKVNPVAGIGMKFMPKNRVVTFSVEYDNRRGASLLIGRRF